jgi:aromatic ring-cleaving dioxygenase
MKGAQYYFQDPQRLAAERIKQRIQQRLNEMK